MRGTEEPNELEAVIRAVIMRPKCGYKSIITKAMKRIIDGVWRSGE